VVDLIALDDVFPLPNVEDGDDDDANDDDANDEDEEEEETKE